MKIYPELTFIPLVYANSPSCDLIIFTQQQRRVHPQVKDPFFVMWLPLNLSEEKLIDSIRKTLPNFPVTKSLTCHINLAYPDSFIQHKFAEEMTLNSASMIIGKTVAKIIPLDKAIYFLTELPLLTAISIEQLNCSSSMYFWSLMTKLALQLVAKGSYIPIIKRIESDKLDSDFFQEKVGGMQAIWRPILKTEKDLQNYMRIQEYAPLSCYNVPYSNKIVTIHVESISQEVKMFYIDDGNNISVSSHLYSISLLSRLFIESVVDLVVRKSITIENIDDTVSTPWELRLIRGLLSSTKQFSIYEVKEEIIPDIIDRWSQRLNLSWDLGFGLKFHLETPQNAKKEWRLNFALQSLSDDLIESSLQDFWEIFQGNNKKIMQKNDALSIREYLLKSFNVLSRIFPPIALTLKQQYPNEIYLQSNDVIILLQTGMQEIRSYGYSFILPESFSIGGSHRIQPVLLINGETPTSVDSMSHIGDYTSFDISSILSYEWVLKIGDTILSEEQKEQIFQTDENQSILFWNNQWIMVDKRELSLFHTDSQLLKGSIKGETALKLALTQNAYLKTSQSEANGPYPVQFYGPLEDILKLINGEIEIPYSPQPLGFNGTLRNYQEVGYNWMKILTSIGFGCVLADDMGLGKTIQVIALILSILSQKNEKRNFLVVCPTSVLGNWLRELHRFAPSINTVLHYGPDRAKEIDGLHNLLQKNDIILSSYNIVRRDISLLELVKWESVILDESQNIKNYKTKQAKAVYRLVDNTKRKIALSGTPIENRVTELWSLYHFVNPFLLGTRTQFMKKYAIPVGRLGNETLIKELRNLVNPFLLRRMKTNKDIIPELPDKQETEVYIQLTEEQKYYYSSVVSSMLAEVKALEENAKQKFLQKGLILKALMQLKQICNHPDQFLHTSMEQIRKIDLNELIAKSGKLERLLELLEEAIASKSKVLIFTQFKVMGDYIQYVIEAFYNIQIPFIHGGVPQEIRTTIVANFQDDPSYEVPILLLSLKAGGLGLNLSKASVVLHYDRWWNPAVEDQATDRAYRIGQENKVNVYKMVVEGTIEERISKMLEEKRALSDQIIEVSGEDWVSELTFKELREIFQFKGESM